MVIPVGYPSQAWVRALAGIYSVYMDSRLKISGMTAITVIIYWGWYNLTIKNVVVALFVI